MKRKETVDITKVDFSGIPCLYIKPANIDGELPLVLLYHGWHSSKENNIFLATILAQRGYKVVLPDAVHHGQRDIINYDENGALERYFWDIIFETIRESEALIQDIIKRTGINASNIAVAGSSMGGFIASGVFALHSNINCLISINGASAFEKAEEVFRGEDGKGLASNTQLDDIRSYDPIKHKDTLYPRPILLLHGDSDSQISISIQQYFYNEVKAVYGDKPERIKLIEAWGVNHQKTIGMVEEMINWLDRYFYE